jgi:hypothetical protein
MLLLMVIDAANAFVPPVLRARRMPLGHARHAAVASTAVVTPSANLVVTDLIAGDVITDTLLDVAVYTILFGVAALTIYSLFVTLQKSNDEYGGWTPRDDDDVIAASKARNLAPEERLRSGARYDPVTEQWTYPAPEKQGPTVGRATASAAPSSVDSSTNRYDRRMAKKQKQKRKKK